MRKNKMMRIASVLLVAVLLSTCAISGTFAKYTSKYTGSADTARVATWNVSLSGATQEKTFAFNLFNTVYDSDGLTENEVKTGENDDVIIAPGTMGYFDIVLTNNSEVAAEFDIALDRSGLNGVPLTISYLNGPAQGNPTTLNSAENIALAMGATVTIRVQWEWAFGANDDDTAHANKSLSVAATVTVDQVD